MTKAELKVLIQFEGVRVAYRNEDNLEIQTLRVVDKEGSQDHKWTFYGYVRTIRQALHAIVNKELLIDHNEIDSVESYLKQVEQGYQEITNKIYELESVENDK